MIVEKENTYAAYMHINVWVRISSCIEGYHFSPNFKTALLMTMTKIWKEIIPRNWGKVAGSLQTCGWGCSCCHVKSKPVPSHMQRVVYHIYPFCCHILHQWQHCQVTEYLLTKKLCILQLKHVTVCHMWKHAEVKLEYNYIDCKAWLSCMWIDSFSCMIL